MKGSLRHLLPIVLVLLHLLIYQRSLGREEEEEDAAHLGKDARQFNFASSTSGAELIDYSPKTGKGFKHLLSDDRDKYALFNCNEKRWVIIGLSEDVQIESIALASYERYSSITKDFQLLAAVSFPQSNWIDLGNFTAEPKLGEQKFSIMNPSSLHTRFVKLRFFNHNFNEDLCTLSQIKVYGKTIYETINSGADIFFAPEDALKEPQADHINSSLSSSNEEESDKSESASFSDFSNLTNQEGSDATVKESNKEVVDPSLSSNEPGNETEQQSITTPETSEIANTSTLPEISQSLVKESSNSTEVVDISESHQKSSEATVHHRDVPDTRPFSEADWHLIRDALIRSNGTEVFYQKAIRKMTDFFRNSLNPLGQQLDQSNLDQFLTKIQSDEDQNKGSQSQLQECNDTSSESENSPERQEKTPDSSSIVENEKEKENERKSNLSEIEPPHLSVINDSATVLNELDSSTNLILREENLVPSTISPENGSEPDLSADMPEPTFSNESLSSSSSNKSTTSEASDHTQVSFFLFNQSMDCLTLLKFAEFRKKRLQEEKKDSNGHHLIDDKNNVNVFNKLFIRIKSIETNEEVIGQFFDEVIKCFQQELQTQQKVVDSITTEMIQMQEKILQIDQFMSQQKALIEEKERKTTERHQKWQNFRNTLKNADGDQHSSAHLSLIALDHDALEDDHTYEQYFQQLFQNQNNTKVSRATSSKHKEVKNLPSHYPRGFTRSVQQLLSQTFRQFSSNPTKEDEDIRESLSLAWSQIYTWSHFHTSDLILFMMIGMGVLVWMVTMLSFLLILWMFFQKKSEKST